MIHEFKPIVSPYFDKDGLTSTHADTIANRLKHMYESTESELNSINFVQTKFGLIGTSEEEYSISKDANKTCDPDELIKKLELITECKAFIAFLREAIKAKDTLSKEVEEYISKELCELDRPKVPAGLSVTEVIDSMTIKERERYLSLETRCAVYGKFIHPGNPFDKAIKGIEKAIANPRDVDYDGANTIIMLQVPTVSIETVNEAYIVLQNEHRKSESELNGIKHIIDETIKAHDKKELDRWKNDLDAYETKRSELTARDAEIREARRKEIQALKIVIPKRFEELYNKVK